MLNRMKKLLSKFAGENEFVRLTTSSGVIQRAKRRRLYR